MTVHKNIEVYGQVVGVFFRKGTQEKARFFGLNGFVQNQPDKSVYMEVEGAPEKVDKLVSWCHSGPAGATVKKVVVTEAPVVGYQSFEIIKE